MVARLLGINGNYAKLMAKLMVLETIHWSRYIYYNHVSGLAQIKPQELRQYIQGMSTGMTGGAEEDQAEAALQKEVLEDNEDWFITLLLLLLFVCWSSLL